MEVKNEFPEKTIWIYTGYTYENITVGRGAFNWIDVLVDGKFDQNQADVNYHWAGSLNQRVIDIKRTIERNKVVLLNQDDEDSREDIRKEFENAAKPLVEFIQKYFHPHAHVIVSADGAELSEGTIAVPFKIND